MDSSNSVVLGLVLAALVLVVGYVGYREFDRQRNIREATEFVGQLAAMPGQMAAQARHDEARRHAIDLRRRLLAPNQRCVGGVVIVQHRDGGFSDLGYVGHLVTCAGRYADRPLR
jgi:hypothetical protein